MPGATSAQSTDAANATGSTATSYRGELIAKVGTVVSAIVASSCCWLPVLLIAVGVSGAGIASALEAYRPLFIVITVAFLAMAFYFTYRPSFARKAATASVAGDDAGLTGPVGSSATGRPARRFNMMALNKVMLWAVTVLVAVFLFFPQQVSSLFVPASGEVTGDMTRTVLLVEGMT